MVTSVDTAGPVVVFRARTRSEDAAAGVGCGDPSDWLHSRYTRRLADTSIGGRPARIEPQVRRLYCENPLCPKATFAEQADGLTVPYQRDRRNAALHTTNAETGFWDDHGRPAPWPDDIEAWTLDLHQSRSPAPGQPPS